MRGVKKGGRSGDRPPSDNECLLIKKIPLRKERRVSGAFISRDMLMESAEQGAGDIYSGR
jgi:hypothetical protein